MAVGIALFLTVFTLFHLGRNLIVDVAFVLPVVVVWLVVLLAWRRLRRASEVPPG